MAAIWVNCHMPTSSRWHLVSSKNNLWSIQTDWALVPLSFCLTKLRFPSDKTKDTTWPLTQTYETHVVKIIQYIKIRIKLIDNNPCQNIGSNPNQANLALTSSVAAAASIAMEECSKQFATEVSNCYGLDCFDEGDQPKWAAIMVLIRMIRMMLIIILDVTELMLIIILDVTEFHYIRAIMLLLSLRLTKTYWAKN